MIIKKVVIIEGKRFVRFLFDPTTHYTVCRGDGIKECRYWKKCHSWVCDACQSIPEKVKGIKTTRKLKHYTYCGE